MVSILLFFIIILSGSFYGSVRHGISAARLIPVTLMSMGIILYVCGLCSALFAGCFIVIAVSLILYLLSVRYIIISKLSLKNCLKDFIAPEIVLFTMLAGILIYFCIGRLAYDNDEFSHWADVVKAMILINDFATNEASYSMFKSYPPAMALIQYFEEQLYLFTNHNNAFSEWRLYYVWELYALSFIFPLLECKDRVIDKFFMFLSFCVCIPIYFEAVYTALKIDPFLSILSGCGMSLVFFWKKKDAVYTTTILLICATLVLSKDVGLFFSIFISIIYLLDRIMSDTSSNKLGSICTGLMPLFTIIIAKFSWIYKLKEDSVTPNFSNPIDIKEYLEMFFLHTGNSYRQSVVNSAQKAFFTEGIVIGNSNYVVSISYAIQLLLIIVVLCFVLIIFNLQKRPLSRTLSISLISVPIIQTLLYASFIGAMYAYKFSEYEATRLASYTRYMNIVFLSIFLIALIGLLISINGSFSGWISLMITVSLLAFVPVQIPYSLLTRSNITYSHEVRAFYKPLENLIKDNCTEDDKVYFISRGDKVYNGLLMKFVSRPILVTHNGDSLGPEYFEGDIWSVNIAPDDWMDTLIDENYSYVAILMPGTDFADNYNSCFDDPSAVKDNTLFLLDKTRRKLVLIN